MILANYTPRPIGEIDEVSQTLFNNKSTRLPTGRAVKPPSRKSKGRSLPGAATRPKSKIIVRSNWLHDFTHVPDTALEPNNSVSEKYKQGLGASSVRRVSIGVDANDSRKHNNLGPAIQSSEHTETTPTRRHPDRLETLVERYGSDVLMQDLPEPFAWRTRLIDDHKRRLVEKMSGQPQRTQSFNLDFKSAIEQGIARGLLRPPTAELQEKIDVAARIEQRKRRRLVAERGRLVGAVANKQNPRATSSENLSMTKRQIIKPKSDRVAESLGRTSKKPRIVAKASGVRVDPREQVCPLPHCSGFNTLEPHQILPPDAYFKRNCDEEKPVWRCGIKHAMGYYYNAGDRKNCPGCFTSIDHNPKLKWMDFYLPSRSYFHQPAPGVIWNLSKQYVKPRRSTTLSHNSIGKDAFWNAINRGSNANVARREAIGAIEEFLRPEIPAHEPAPEPELEPDPEPETVKLGPHPSGSKTMEHGQDIPECAYWDKKERDEELAWRCDVNHAFGRYYISGAQRTCPGCGSNKSATSAKRAAMDFYLPDGVVVRQDAPDLVKWHPRKPYNTKRIEKTSKDRGKQGLSHNQTCSKKYWDAIEAGKEHDVALAGALGDIDAWLDARNEARRIKQEKLKAEHKASQKAVQASEHDNEEPSSPEHEQIEGSTENGVAISWIPRKRGREEFSDSEMEEVDRSGQETPQAANETIHTTSSDDSTSSSDSE
jgi:hypothetical protein